ncbi:MAG: SpoIIE family protein phosphatase [Acidobacteriia bacterium]|nr:SpoIIE family protein phosphatase [Terriglobia bacterium]
MGLDVTGCNTGRQASDRFEWYIIESPRSGSPLAHRATQFGPFATEDECGAFLDSVKQIRRFSDSTFELHKRPERRDKRHKVEYLVRLCQPGNDHTLQLGRTIDVSVSGAHLGSLKAKLNLGQVIEIHVADRTAPFQVVWVGSGTTEDQAGVECLAPEVNLWKLDVSELTEDERLLREIDRARTVQSRLFPQEMPALRTLDYCGRCVQARTVGGDYYDFLPIAPGNVGFVLADVSGKGIAAALLMANLQGSLQAQCALGASDPLQLLASVNCHLHKHTEIERYVTVFFGCYNDHTRKLRYVNCGHSPPLLLRHGGGVERLDATATVLGLFPQWEGEIVETPIEPGDIVSMYTDGVTEASGKNGEEFGEARLLSALRQNQNLEAASLLERVEQIVEEFRCGERHDDLTMIIGRSR